MSVFSNEIADLKKALEQKRAKLQELEKRRDAHAEQTQKAREALEDLRAALRGETPPSKRSARRTVRGISKVPVDDDTGRPARGARRDQIEQICRKIGADGGVFRTADVLEILRDVEGDDEGNISKGMRSYTYTVMDSLEDDGMVKRKGRGKWRLA